MEHQQIYIVKVFDGRVESFYFSKKELAQAFVNERKQEMKEEYSDRKMKDYGSMVTFTKKANLEDIYAIYMEMDYLDLVR